ncbi:MAG: histidine phosphatase family protein [Bacteroidaceae bacterium]|nr:histidine phosphatase family protein [Bacteroidaceae bacterium]
MKLYIARHGQTEENVQRILQGQMPGHLTETGIRQAEELREKLRDIRFERILTSDLLRAVDTTRIISEPHGGQFELEPLLRERDFGIHTGGPYIKISHDLDPSAETMKQLSQRAADFLNKVSMWRGAEEEECNLLAVSHGLFLRVLQAVYHNVEIRSIEKMENAEVRVLHLEHDMHFDISLQKETGGTAN